MTKSIKIIFTLSILMNLIVIGSVIGIGARWYYGQHYSRGMHFTPMMIQAEKFKRLLKGVEDLEQQALLEQRFDVFTQENNLHLEHIRGYRHEILQLAVQEPYSPEDYNQLVQKLLDKKFLIERAYADLLGDLLAALPTKEREKALKRLNRGQKRFARHDYRDGHHDRD